MGEDQGFSFQKFDLKMIIAYPENTKEFGREVQPRDTGLGITGIGGI